MRSYWLILPLVLLCAAQSRADSVMLITGEKITGTIKSESDAEVVIEVPVSASITDERVIRKEDIAKVDKEQPDEIAYQQLIQIQANHQLSYSSQTYDQILTALYGFETNYPNSTHLAAIKNLATTFQDEKRRVDAGQFKYLGQWLSKDEAIRRRIQIVGLEVLGTMQQQATAGDFVGAMQTFSTIERDYGTTRAFPAAVTLALQIIPRLEQDLVGRMDRVKADQAELKNTIAFTAEPAKSALIAQAKAEEDRATAAVAAAVQSGAKWVPLIDRSQVSIDTLQKTAVSEASRLASIPVAAMNQSIVKVEEARTAISQNDFKTADTLLKDATTLWAQNEAAHYWGDRLKEETAAPVAKTTSTPKPLPTVRPVTQVAGSTSSAAAPVVVSEDKPYYETVTGIISILAGVLVVGGIIASVIQKKSRKQPAE